MVTQLSNNNSLLRRARISQFQPRSKHNHKNNKIAQLKMETTCPRKKLRLSRLRRAQRQLARVLWRRTFTHFLRSGKSRSSTKFPIMQRLRTKTIDSMKFLARTELQLSTSTSVTTLWVSGRTYQLAPPNSDVP